jgi:2-polyprenyl-6-methoxyphenol hydroxylase-like FAD-dependent oxidoreductase
VAICTTANFLALDRTGVLYPAPGRTAAMYSARDNTEAKVGFFFDSPPLAYDRGDVEGQRALVAAAFAGGGWEIPRLLAAMWDAPDFYFDTVSQVHMDSQSRGRTVLVGDAGYCPSLMSGMGTSLALVGASVLAAELAAADGDHRWAFRRHHAEMRDLVTRSQAVAHDTRAWFLPAAPAGAAG